MALEITNPNAPLYGDYRDWGKGGRYGPTGENAPQQIARSEGDTRHGPQFDYWETDPDKVNAYLAAHANDPAIQAAAQRGDGSLDHELLQRGFRVPEHFKAGVGPDGHVIVKEMSWWDKQKNWALPAIGIGAAIAAPYALGALSGGGAPAAGGIGIGETGATTGLAGSGLTAGGVGLGETGAVTGLAGSGFTGGGAAAGGGWGGLAHAATKYAKPIAGALNTAANTMANNRGVELGANQFADQVATQRQAENRAERDDTWKRLQNANYVLNPHASGFEKFGSTFTRPELTDPMRQGAEGLQREALLRLTNGPQIKPLTDVSKMAKPSKWERLAGYGGLAASIYGGTR